MIRVRLSWIRVGTEVLGDEFDKDYMHELREFLVQQKAAGKVIYPPGSQWFSAFNNTPFDQVRAGNSWPGSLSRSQSGPRSVFFSTARR